ncbi:conserved hypothetical protein [Perkinsus marinus ATCC 50983]|uniref:Uncharacterized protein n=1 Tax=Perkinsus marinus (strain ATCC 50983 / TXsc) TaxID=423536 RepID=C5LV24_PERM5|nr:conserved hypothetical protein [Perkinsus marinus ATCC 50983]EEQ99418.1 conserved hypothetical protein [Perkinsus marinus ATCC 50983]|eukprot:XP_002766701.1 conserved hypothetical protein [Perkinsus marinus ATCC 50983]
MSMNLQKQIRDNGTDIQEYLKELNKWTRDLKQQSSSNIVSDNASKEREEKIDDDGKVDVLLRNEEVMQKGQLSRDNAKDMKSYYEAWEKLNVDDYDKDGYECKKAIIDATNHEHYDDDHSSPMIPYKIITSTAPQKQKVNIRKVAGRRSKLEYALEAKERGNAFYKKG